MEKEKITYMLYLKDRMEFYLFLSLKEKGVNQQKYLYYLAQASNYKDLYEEELKKAGITEEELIELSKQQ